MLSPESSTEKVLEEGFTAADASWAKERWREQSMVVQTEDGRRAIEEDDNKGRAEAVGVVLCTYINIELKGC